MFEGTDWLKVFTDIDAIQRTSKERPIHWVMSSGKHSDVRIDMWKLYEHPALYSRACRDLLKRARYRFGSQDRPTWFFGPERGGVPMAFELARQAGVRAGFTVKTSAGWEAEHALPDSADIVGLADDVITTGNSIVSICDALEHTKCGIGSPIFTFVNRGGMRELCVHPRSGFLDAYFNWRSVISLVDIKEPGWKAENCPMCAEKAPIDV